MHQRNTGEQHRLRVDAGRHCGAMLLLCAAHAVAAGSADQGGEEGRWSGWWCGQSGVGGEQRRGGRFARRCLHRRRQRDDNYKAVKWL